MKKTLSLILCLGLLIGTMTAGLLFSSSAESLYIRKIVSVVYDDSGSMSNRGCVNWAYANYALQSFCGLLNSDDQLYVTYMSDAENNPYLDPPRIDLDAGAVQRSVDSIRRHTKAGNTPYEAIDVAFRKLQNTANDNPNTQYWLVIISDGEFQSWGGNVSEAELNDKLSRFAGTKMPNGSMPQISYLAIGNHATKPKANENSGIFVYESSGASDIIKTMSAIADKVSGRSRLEAKNIKKKDGKTIELKSSVPLLNIAVLAQGTDARIVSASDDESALSVSKSASVAYPENGLWTTDRSLVGGAFLVSHEERNIGAGTYRITFDKDVDLDDLVIMFEPALEVKMTVSLDGTELGSMDELDRAMEGNRISLSYKIYEMGTDKEIEPGKMPSGTKYQIYVSEDGKKTTTADGKMMLDGYTLKPVRTRITAAVTIAGFNPIEYTLDFTPREYVPTYTLEAAYANNLRSVRYENIASNGDMVLSFSVYKDGVLMTDPAEVKALNPVVTLSPGDNSGITTYAGDGRILFTPNAASSAFMSEDSFDVEATCTIADGTAVSCSYTVLIADYQVIPLPTDAVIKKTGFFDNRTGVSFYITKNGVKVGKAEVENRISVQLNPSYAKLISDVVVSNDGTITVTPHSEKEHKLTFWNWWWNWAYYFGLPGDDLVVTLNHAFGTADTVIGVVGEDAVYLIFAVFLPLAIELFLILWAILILTKPRYLQSATLFVGQIKYNRESGTHTVRGFSAVKLKKFNKLLKLSNGRLKFKRTADTVSANGIKVRADRGGRIICEMPFPWYKSKVEPLDEDAVSAGTPAGISEYITRHKKLEINEFATTETVEGEYERVLAPANPKMGKYIVVPDSGNGVTVVDGKRVIGSGKIFIYINE